MPLGVNGFNEGDFAFAEPAFEFFFASNGGADVGEKLEVDQLFGFVARREAGEQPCFVLEDTPIKIVGDADVEHAGCGGHDVCGVGLHGTSAAVSF